MTSIKTLTEKSKEVNPPSGRSYIRNEEFMRWKIIDKSERKHRKRSMKTFCIFFLGYFTYDITGRQGEFYEAADFTKLIGPRGRC